MLARLASLALQKKKFAGERAKHAEEVMYLHEDLAKERELVKELKAKILECEVAVLALNDSAKARHPPC